MRLILLLLLSALLFFFNLGSFSLYDAAETTYGEFVKNILQSGDWLTLHFNGQIIFDKPPLYYWLAAMLSKLIGFNEFSMRFWAAISGVLTVLITYLLGKKFYHQKVGFFSALMVMTAFQFLVQSRIAEIDILLTLLTTLSIYWFYSGYKENNKKFYMLSYIPMGLAILVKGLLGVALPAAAIFLFLLSKKELNKLKEMHPLAGLFIILAIGFPWYIAEYILHGKVFLDFAIGFLFLSRFGNIVAGHTGPWYYYFIALILGFAPWSPFLPYAFIRTWQTKKIDPALISLCFILPAFVVFSIAKTKIPNYILPLYPFLAIMVGKLWDDFLGASRQETRKGMTISFILQAVVVILIILAIVIAGKNYSGPFQAMLSQLYFLAAILIVSSFFSILLYFMGFKIISFSVIPLMVFILIGFLTLKTLPAVEKYKGTKELGKGVSEVIKTNEQIAAYDIGNRPGVVFYNSKIVFFLSGEAEAINFLKQKKGYCFTQIHNADKFKSYAKEFARQGELVVLH